MWADELAAALTGPADGHPGRTWLRARGVPDDAPNVGAGLLPEGIAYPDEFTWWAQKFDWTAGAVLVSRNWNGLVTGFQTRHPAEKTYYKFEVYGGQRVPMMWGADLALDGAWATQHLIVTEGAFDALACYLAGARNVVATLSANPSRLMVRWMLRLAKRATILYDMDDPGRTASKKLAWQLRAAGLIVSEPNYNDHDPWDLWRSRPEALQALVR